MNVRDVPVLGVSWSCEVISGGGYPSSIKHVKVLGENHATQIRNR